MHRQAGDAQRGRIVQTVAQEGGEHERREKDWESRRLGGGLRFGFFAGPGEEHGRRRRRCPLRERQREAKNGFPEGVNSFRSATPCYGTNAIPILSTNSLSSKTDFHLL